MKKLLVSISRKISVIAMALMVLLLPIGLLPMVAPATVSATSNDVMCCVITDNAEQIEAKWDGLLDKSLKSRVLAHVDKNKNPHEYTVDDFKQMAQDAQAVGVLVVKVNNPVPANAFYSTVNWDIQYINVAKNATESVSLNIPTPNDAQ